MSFFLLNASQGSADWGRKALNGSPGTCRVTVASLQSGTTCSVIETAIPRHRGARPSVFLWKGWTAPTGQTCAPHTDCCLPGKLNLEVNGSGSKNDIGFKLHRWWTDWRRRLSCGHTADWSFSAPPLADWQQLRRRSQVEPALLMSRERLTDLDLGYWTTMEFIFLENT